MKGLRHILFFAVIIALHLVMIQSKTSVLELPVNHTTSEQVFMQLPIKGHAIEVQSGFKLQTPRTIKEVNLFQLKSEVSAQKNRFLPYLAAANSFTLIISRFPDYFQSVDIIFPFHTFF
ncbi:MAG: hypothetical protein Q4G27_06775 [Flavobacteriaceae bacterium]|nr:hypothetical protein [Flavobacteriaceae bacterium]